MTRRSLAVAAVIACGWLSTEARAGFGIKEAEFLRAFNADTFSAWAGGVRLQITRREMADDRVREVLDFSFGRTCARGLGSSHRGTKEIMSFHINTSERCFSDDSYTVLLLYRAAIHTLCGVADVGKVGDAVTELTKRFADAEPTDVGNRSGTLNFGRCGLLVMSVPIVKGLLFFVAPE